ncbi:MAG: hypothetical protein LBS47_00135 [Endomicrobium sp.]|jgi:biotin carboxyl carrier protein|nr:hypothetical protein [Endomicrobium sp.]
MNLQEIKDFLKSIKNTDIEEMQYQSGGVSLYFKRTDVEPVLPPIVKEIITNQSKKEEKQTPLVVIKSTTVGTFVSSQSDDVHTLIKEGDTIVIGQRIGQIEAMKIIKDINSSINGKIVKIFVSNGQPVEYGQELFLVDTGK